MPVPLFRPFAGLRPRPSMAPEIASPPYDVLSSDEARELAKASPWCFLRVSKPEIDLDPAIDVYDPRVYARGAENLRTMRECRVLRQDPQPCFYVYRLTMGDHVQTGVVGGASVAAYEINRIRKHEFTRPEKEDDRVRQIEACNAQTGPVLLAHPDNAVIAEAIAATIATTRPVAGVHADDGIYHKVWVMEDAALIAQVVAAFDAMPAVYIADGHHRSAAAARVAAARRGKQGGQGDDALHESFLAVSFPISEMRILDYNRVVKDLAGMDPAAFLAALEREFTVTPAQGQARPQAPRQFGLYVAGRWYSLAPRNPLPPESDPVARLDVSLLSDRLLGPVLGIHDLRKDKRIDFVGGKRGLDELERRVNSREMAAAFALFPTGMTDLVAVADAGEVMPPKSTWFEPKLADGLVSYPLD